MYKIRLIFLFLICCLSSLFVIANPDHLDDKIVLPSRSQAEKLISQRGVDVPYKIIDQVLNKCENSMKGEGSEELIVNINEEISTDPDKKLSWKSFVGIAVVGAALALKYGLYGDFSDIPSDWSYLWAALSYAGAAVNATFTGISVARFCQYAKRAWKGEMTAKEYCFLVPVSLYGVVSSGFDGYRIMTEGCPDGVSFLCGLMGVPEILTVFFHTFETYQLVFGHQPAKYRIASGEKGNDLSNYLQKKGATQKDVERLIGKSEDAIGSDTLKQANECAMNGVCFSSKSSPDHPGIVSVELDCNDRESVEFYLVKEEVQPNTGIKVMSWLIATGSSTALIAVEQLTTLYRLLGNNAADHIVKYITMGGHYIGNVLLEKCAVQGILEKLSNCCGNANYRVSFISKDEAKSLIDEAKKRQIKVIKKLGDKAGENEPKLVLGGKKGKIIACVAGVGSVFSTGYYQFVVSSRMLECTLARVTDCLSKGAEFSWVLTSAVGAWNYVRQYANVLLPKRPDEMGAILGNTTIPLNISTVAPAFENITQSLLNGTDIAQSQYRDTALDMVTKILSCPTVKNACESGSFMAYQAIISGLNVVPFIIPSMCKMYAIYLERELLYDFFERCRNSCRGKRTKPSKKKFVPASATFINTGVLGSPEGVHVDLRTTEDFHE